MKYKMSNTGKIKGKGKVCKRHGKEKGQSDVWEDDTVTGSQRYGNVYGHTNSGG